MSSGGQTAPAVNHRLRDLLRELRCCVLHARGRRACGMRSPVPVSFPLPVPGTRTCSVGGWERSFFPTSVQGPEGARLL